MSIFGSLMAKIMGHEARKHEETVNAAVAENAPAASTPSAAPTVAAEPVDVEAVLEGMAQNKQGLDWRHSIVDLMKLVGIDSSMANRKELANELGYTANTDDSAAMNIWLHKQVMAKLAENGGNVPASMLD